MRMRVHRCLIKWQENYYEYATIDNNQKLVNRIFVLYNNFIMSFWKRILYWLRLRSNPGPEYYRLDEKLQLKLINLALQEGRSEVEVIDELVTAGLEKHSAVLPLLQNWQSLSAREQDVTALACLGYTNPQIAVKLSISIETVKSHMSSTLYKLNLHSRKQLSVHFSGWDFSAWEN